MFGRLLTGGRGRRHQGELDLELHGSLDDADHLVGAFALLTGLQLKRQIADYRDGATIGSFVDPRRLTERERRQLKEGLRAINEFRARVRAELAGALL